MKQKTWAFHLSAVERRGMRRRRLEERRLELQVFVEGVMEGLRAGCLPDPFAVTLIARIVKRGGFRAIPAFSHVR
jgi:hypothetical protein